jgi:hypothetical protein
VPNTGSVYDKIEGSDNICLPTRLELSAHAWNLVRSGCARIFRNGHNSTGIETVAIATAAILFHPTLAPGVSGARNKVSLSDVQRRFRW